MRKTSCPVAEQSCRDFVFFEQNLLLADSQRVELIAMAAKKVRNNAGQLHKIEIEEDHYIWCVNAPILKTKPILEQKESINSNL